MTSAFVLINADPDAISEVLRDVRNCDGVEEANCTHGIYDVVAKVKADSMEELKDLVTKVLRRLDNVSSTLTLILVE